MKLKRDKLVVAKRGRTAGFWLSADGRWCFVRDEGPHRWQILALDENSVVGDPAGNEFLRSLGLADADFPTRRAAVAALTQALAATEPE